jgi:crotonobetainyl-CoA:carnitine CoA-transferase CaiB-like acyl-CoA transferase
MSDRAEAGATGSAAALPGLRVVELASILAGPSVGSFLGELGADVVKVEDLGSGGDTTRSWRLAGETSREGRSTYFSSINFGKRSVALRWRHPEGLSLVRRLAARADVVLASFKPGREVQLGLDYASLAELNSRLIYAWISGFGPTDSRPGYDMLLQAQAGWMAMNGHPDTPPARLPVAIIDLFAGHQLKEAILLALYQRERTGKGQLVTVSLWDAALGGLANQASNYLMEECVPERLGSQHPNLCPYGAVLECRDGGVLVAPGNDRQFEGLARALACPELAERFPTNPERVGQRAVVIAALQQAAGALTREELLAELALREVPASPLHDLSEVFSDPLAGRLVMRAEGCAAVRTASFASALELSAPPRLGEHTAEVLAELGLTPEEVARLQVDGVV